MGVEELKLILETLENAGQGAWWIALLWVLKGYFSMLTFTLVCIYALRVGYSTILQQISWRGKYTEIAQFLGEPLPMVGTLQEHCDVMKRLRRLKE